MVMAYFMAQLMPWATDPPVGEGEAPLGGGLLVLGSANVDEALRGYYTKYDCSAADINPIVSEAQQQQQNKKRRTREREDTPRLSACTPAAVCTRRVVDHSESSICPFMCLYLSVSDRLCLSVLGWLVVAQGGINKRDLKSFLEWAGVHKGIDVLARVAAAQPSAELTGSEGAQLDEEDMGMSYSELADLGHCRKVEHCGPLTTFLKLRQRWNDGRRITPSIRCWKDGKLVTAEEQERAWSFDEKVAQKVKDFFFCKTDYTQTQQPPQTRQGNQTSNQTL